MKTPREATPGRAGIDSVRIRAESRAGDETFVEVAVVDPANPRRTEIVIVRRGFPNAFAFIDVNDLLSALQVIRPRSTT